MFKCVDCGEEFEDEGDLGMHVVWAEGHGEETGDGKYRCTICGEEFEDEGDLEIHIMWTERKGKMTGRTLKEFKAFVPLIKCGE